MIKIDLITGFLGSGKTTFLKMYARRLLDSGLKIGILENDYGAVNVDMMLLGSLEGENCGLEMVAGACDADCHRRRFKTKLIALGMSGYDRVLVEPSGLFDIDEFFDVLHESPLDRWYEPGNVIAVVDAKLEDDLSDNSAYLLASQAAMSGLVVLSKSQFADENDFEKTVAVLNRAMKKAGCPRSFALSEVLTKPWSMLDDTDFNRIFNCGYRPESFVKLLDDSSNAYQSLYYLDVKADENRLKKLTKILMNDGKFGNVFRIKGFVRKNGGWLELNATRSGISISSTEAGQDIIIVIGESLDKEKIDGIMNCE